ncbi:MAG: DUF4230 domain-containing protein [Candidatus Acidiferrales bacterium]
MSSAPQTTPPRRISGLAGALLGVLATLAVVALGIWLIAGVHLLDLFRLARGGTTFHVDQPTVVRQIQQLQRLETVRYTMDKIISGEHDNPYLPQFLAGDRLLLVVHGEVVGGIDLTKLQPTDVAIRGRDITVQLPPSEVFSTRLDNAKTRVYSRDTGLFTSPDPNLESQVREEAERELQQASLQDGILKTADQNAANTITSLLKGLGFANVTIQ